MIFVLAHESECFLGEEVVRVSLAIEGHLLIVAPQKLGVIIVGGNMGFVTEEVIEADGFRISGGIGAAHAPFADDGGIVTGLLKNLAKRGDVVRQRRITLGRAIPVARSNRVLSNR